MRAPRRQSRFGGKLYLVLLESRSAPSLRSGRSLWALQRSLIYRTGPERDAVITVPAGFVTDLASIPRPIWSFFPPDGPWVKGAIIHDFLYYTQGTGEWYGRDGIDRPEPYTRAESDWILNEAMLDLQIGAWARFVIYTAVRLGGWIGWARKHDKPRPHPNPSTLQPPSGRPL